MGVGGAINEIGLIGVGFERHLNPHFSLGIYGGLGGWGTNLMGNLTAYFNESGHGPSLSIGLKRAGGIDNISTTMDFDPESDPKIVNMKFSPNSTLNLCYNYNFGVFESSKFVFTLGYAFALSDNPYTILDAGVSLTETEQTYMNIMQPGGLILGLKFMYGLQR